MVTLVCVCVCACVFPKIEEYMAIEYTSADNK